MGISEILAIGAGLAVDAVCVAVTNGMGVTEKKTRLSLLTALFFGFFQGIMPFIGFFAANLCSFFFAEKVVRYSHLIVAAIFFLLGGKAIAEALREEEKVFVKSLPVRLLLLQAIATSMDAMAVGVSFSLLQTPVLPACIIIGTMTFFLCLPAFWLGDKSSSLSECKVGIFGGVILILIGVKSLIGG